MRREKTTLLRKLSISGFELVEGSHCFFALLDFDVTDLRRHLRDLRLEGGGGSLFTYLLKAVGKCLEDFPEFNAMIDRKRTTYFDEVDVNIPIEIETEGTLVPKQYIIRDINRKSLQEVDREVAASKNAKDDPAGYVFSRTWQRALGLLPGGLVLFLLKAILRKHDTVKRLSGTVFVTSVSMFSNISGYVIPYAGGPKAVSFAIGSVSKKPVVRKNAVQIREMINVTAIFNHDLIDGAPAARFINRLRTYIEVSYRDLSG